MPLMDGPTLFTKLRERQPALKCIFMSGYTEGAIEKSGVLEQGAVFLQKPFTLSGLATVVRETLDEEGDVKAA